MKFLRFSIGNKIKYGIMEKNNEVKEIKGSIFDKYEILEKTYSLLEIKYLPPTVPTKIIALGLNYFDHAKEFK